MTLPIEAPTYGEQFYAKGYVKTTYQEAFKANYQAGNSQELMRDQHEH